MRAFNELAEANGRRDALISEQDIAWITEKAAIPEHLSAERADDPARRHPILFRRVAGPAQITVFDGGHDTDFPTAVRWLEKHSR